VPSSVEARAPENVAPLSLSEFVQLAKALTLPLMSIVQSPAGIIMPSIATEDAERTAPTTDNLILLFRKIYYVKNYLSN